MRMLSEGLWRLCLSPPKVLLLHCVNSQGCEETALSGLCGLGPQNWEQLHPWDLFVPSRVLMLIISGCSCL